MKNLKVFLFLSVFSLGFFLTGGEANAGTLCDNKVPQAGKKFVKIDIEDKDICLEVPENLDSLTYNYINDAQIKNNDTYFNPRLGEFSSAALLEKKCTGDRQYMLKLDAIAEIRFSPTCSDDPNSFNRLSLSFQNGVVQVTLLGVEKRSKDEEATINICLQELNKIGCTPEQEIEQALIPSNFENATSIQLTENKLNGPCKDLFRQCVNDIQAGIDPKDASDDPNKNNPKYKKPDGYNGPLPDCSFSYEGCRDINDLLAFLIKIGGIVFQFIGSFAFAMFVYGGFTIILSMGNSEKVKKGQEILVAAVVGMLIAFGAYLLIDFVLDALQVGEIFRGQLK